MRALQRKARRAIPYDTRAWEIFSAPLSQVTKKGSRLAAALEQEIAPSAPGKGATPGLSRERFLL